MSKPGFTELNPEIRCIVDAARGVWIRRLIDYSRANSLLFYRDLKLGTLDLMFNSNAVDRLLAGNALNIESLVSAVSFPNSHDPVTYEASKSEPRQKIREALVAIQRKALSNLEEKGIETLHLAMGLATWSASDGGRPYNAPVLLLPARIDARGRSSEDLRLTVAGEPQLNPVLLYVLEETHGIRINASGLLNDCGGEDESGQWRIDPQGVLARLEHATTTVPEFTVTRRVILANFQFAKMAMVEDLKRNSEAIASNSIIAAIAGHSASRQKLAQAVAEIESIELDERPAADDYLVLDADSTQHRAIVLVSKGQNGVVQGPPGTGKSQTIANIIAQSVAEGRRVLFVAEKRAALDAVIKRLSLPDVGLSHLVLDLHGASVSRKEVMARLADALDQIRHAAPAEGAETLHQEFEARRKQLNQHARRVNIIRHPSGLSVNQMIGKLLRLPLEAKSGLRFRGDVLAQITADRATELKHWILQGAANATLLLGTDPSPWNNANITDGRRAQEALDLVTKLASELWPRFERLLGSVVQELGVRRPATFDDVGTLLAVLRDVRRLRE